MVFLFNKVSSSTVFMRKGTEDAIITQTEAGWIAEVGWASGGGAHGFFDVGDSVLDT